MPILIRHQTARPFVQAAANSSQFGAQRELNAEAMNWNQMALQDQQRRDAMAQQDQQFQQNMQFERQEMERQDQLRRDLEAQEAQNRLLLAQEDARRQAMTDAANYQRAVDTATINQRGQDQRGAADRTSRESIAEQNRKAANERAAQSNARQGAQTFMREAGNVIGKGIDAAKDFATSWMETGQKDFAAELKAEAAQDKATANAQRREKADRLASLKAEEAVLDSRVRFYLQKKAAAKGDAGAEKEITLRISELYDERVRNREAQAAIIKGEEHPGPPTFTDKIADSANQFFKNHGMMGVSSPADYAKAQERVRMGSQTTDQYTRPAPTTQLSPTWNEDQSQDDVTAAQDAARSILSELPPNMTPQQKKAEVARRLAEMGFDLQATGAI